MTEPVFNPTPPPPAPSTGLKSSLIKLIPLFVIVLIAIVGFIYLSNRISTKKSAPLNQQPIQGVSVPTEYDPIKGTVISVQDRNLVLKVNSQTKGFTLAPNPDIQQQSNPSPVKLGGTPISSTSTIKPGQTVSLQFSKNTGEVVSILILSDSSFSSTASVKLPITSVSGTVESIGADSISLSNSNDTKSYSFDPKVLNVIKIPQTKDDQAKANLSDIKTGNEVNLTIDNKTQKVLSIMIIK